MQCHLIDLERYRLVFLVLFFFFSSRRRHTRSDRDWSSDVCCSDLIDELTSKLRQMPGQAEQRATARRIVDREYDQVLRMWMPWGTQFVLFQPHLRNAAGGVLRGTVGYGSPTIARLWLDK